MTALPPGMTVPLPLAHWTAEDFAKAAATARYLRDHQMGRDVTDFGCGTFPGAASPSSACATAFRATQQQALCGEALDRRRGTGDADDRHRVKMEDIINRAGGVLMLEFAHADTGGNVTNTPVVVHVDGARLGPVGELPHRRDLSERGSSSASRRLQVTVETTDVLACSPSRMMPWPRRRLQGGRPELAAAAVVLLHLIVRSRVALSSGELARPSIKTRRRVKLRFASAFAMACFAHAAFADIPPPLGQLRPLQAKPRRQGCRQARRLRPVAPGRLAC